jgi:hypothetical protein
MGREVMLSKILLVALAATCVFGAIGCKGTDADAEAAALSPKPKAPDATPADRANAVNSNPNISPEVKKVIGGGSKGL